LYNRGKKLEAKCLNILYLILTNNVDTEKAVNYAFQALFQNAGLFYNEETL
jgi:hypothetical protein